MSGALNSLANMLWAFAPGTGGALQCNDLKLVAHRGAHEVSAGIVENTMPAFQRCLDAGVWGLEMDIRLTLDHEPVIHHDSDCGRLFDRPDVVIEEMTFARLRDCVPHVPHLSEVVSCFGGKMHLMLEVKESWRQRSLLVDAVHRELSGLEPVSDYHLLALEPDHLEGFRKVITPSAYVDVSEINTNKILKQTLELGHGALAGSFALIGARQLEALRMAGCCVGTGMVGNRRVLRREVHRGIDWIFTDRILSLQKAGNL